MKRCIWCSLTSYGQSGIGSKSTRRSLCCPIPPPPVSFLGPIWTVSLYYRTLRTALSKDLVGFLGIMLALHHCRSVNVYEYVPSMRLTKRCHYYDDEENLGCTIGDWHPLAAEKLVSLALNQADKLKVFSDGVLVIPGKLRLGNCTKSSAPEMNHGAL